MDVIDINQAVSKAVNRTIAKLEKDEKIGRVFPVLRAVTYDAGVTCNDNEELPGLYTCLISTNTWVELTDVEVRITWDGVKHHYVIDKSFSGAYRFGNESLVEEDEDTGEPFFIVVDFDQETVLVIAETPGFHSLKVECYEGKVTPIDPKFLPGVCLPVVELTTMIPIVDSSGGGIEASFSDAENDALNNAVGLPCVIKCSVSGTLVTGVFTYLPTDTVQSYMLTFSSLVVNIHKDAEAWEAYAVLA